VLFVIEAYPSVCVSAHALPINSTITIRFTTHIFIKHARYTKRIARPLLLSVVVLYLPPLHERLRPPFRLKLCHTAPLATPLPVGAKNMQLSLPYQARPLHKKKHSAFIVECSCPVPPHAPRPHGRAYDLRFASNFARTLLSVRTSSRGKKK